MTPVLTIHRLGHHGDGIASGGASEVYVPFTLPGERVSGKIMKGRIEAATILSPSDARVRPPCPHFKVCGGCALQHASDSFLSEWKADIVRQALAAHALEAPNIEVLTSPAHSRRRATLAGRRSKKGALVGFHARASNNILAIPRCTVLHPDILAALPDLEALTRIGASRKAEISLAVTVSRAGLDIAVDHAKEADGPMLAQLAALAGQSGFARLTWNGEVVATLAPPLQRFGRADILPPAAGFLQATEAGQCALTEAVQSATAPARRILDLFAGCGTFTLPLAETAEVAAFESDAGALAALDAGWRRISGLKAVTTETRDLFRRPLLEAELNRHEAVVIDPPRAGAKAQSALLAQSTVARIAYVSCNPLSFARDAARLVAGGYRLDWIRVVDQFRWSPHVELVAALSR